jgi:Ion channel
MVENRKITKHAQLLMALVATELLRPTIARSGLGSRAISVVVFGVIGFAIFRAVFHTQYLRRVGMVLILATLGIALIATVVPEDWNTALEVALNLAASVFYGFVLWAIVDHMFGAKNLRTDDIAGAFSGYILLALIWGRLYAIAYRVMPESFSIASGIRWQLDDWNTLHALFDYFSFTVISSIGYGDITTTRPFTNTLIWLEVLCGQFYLAVVVASIVGIKVSQALAAARDAK